MKDTPLYMMPAEWSKHWATQLHWPSNRETWPGDRLERVEEVYCRIIEELHFYEPIHLFVESLKARNRVMQKLSLRAIDLDQLTIHQQKINDVWARDCGPIFVKQNNRYVITNWTYNAWGEKYPPWEDDNKLPGYIAAKYGIKCLKPDMVLEGGAIEVNGEGLLLTTESVLLNPNRNPDMDRAAIEEKLKTYLGAEQVLWLKGGLAGDDTDGHIDDVCRFINKDTVLAMVSDDPGDVNYNMLQQNLEILHSIELYDGTSLNIETLPLPHTKIEGTTVDGSAHVPASYANFYVANGVVLLPFYNHPYDQEAKKLLERYFGGRKIIGIDCTDLVWGQGALHCITQPWYN
ncbi:MAG: agmatine deiminase family protein [Balneolaceae bacterium]|nr:agmatine deiminase family protein [Balneolaceae bacterium]